MNNDNQMTGLGPARLPIQPEATLPHSFVHSTSQLGGHLNRMLPQKFWTGLIGI